MSVSPAERPAERKSAGGVRGTGVKRGAYGFGVGFSKDGESFGVFCLVFFVCGFCVFGGCLGFWTDKSYGWKVMFFPNSSIKSNRFVCEPMLIPFLLGPFVVFLCLPRWGRLKTSPAGSAELR